MPKVAIVTGASRGIGAAIAKLLAEQGYAVAVHYNSSQAAAQKVVEEIHTKGGKAIAIKAQLNSEPEIVALFQQVERELGPISALVNNAGIDGGRAAFEELTLEKLQEVFQVNTFATFLCCREAVKAFKKHKVAGGIVNVSSEAAKLGGFKLLHYGASKAAINTLTIGLAKEVGEDGVRVNAVSPGIIGTEHHLQAPLEKKQRMLDSIPLGRMGTPEEVAKIVSWLLSEESSYVSGAIISIAGAR